jgi:two-component system response regulator ChvI
MDSTLSKRPSRRILVVDDDALFRESLVQNLSDAGFETAAFAGGAEALAHLAEAGTPDLILLDWKMPGMTGIDVLREMRKLKIETPVVFLTVLDDQIYEEAGLLGGAADFIEKSRSFSILLRRIALIFEGHKAAASAVNGQKPAAGAKQGRIGLHPDIHRAVWNDSEIDLTLTEFRIVEYLVGRPGHDVRYRELYDIVHGEGFAAGSGDAGFRVNVRSFIKRIRQKFRDIDPEFSQIENYPGFGYRWRIGDGG